MTETISYLCPIGYQYNICGYCKSRPQRTSPSFYAESFGKVHPIHYQKLVDRGWRRSGTLFYKPNPRRACCPHHTIRLDAVSFKPTKSQRQSMNRWHKYLLGVEYQHKLARLCPRSREEKRLRRTTFDLRSVVNDAQLQNQKRPRDPKTGEIVQPAHKWELSLESDDFTEEKYALFKHYQTHVHKEPSNRTTRANFKDFLCSGMGQHTYDADGEPRKVGSFHQCYRIDGRLAAIAVLDLLPHGVSSVYFLYHTDFVQFSMGRISAMVEISMTIEKGYDYYYMGYYIHSCPKMRYKRDFNPTYVLDSQTHEWNLLDQAMLDALSKQGRRQEQGLSATGRCSVFSEEMPGIVDGADVPKMIELSEVRYSFNGRSATEFGSDFKWDPSSIPDPSSLQGMIAELLACLGPDLTRNIAIVMQGL